MCVHECVIVITLALYIYARAFIRVQNKPLNQCCNRLPLNVNVNVNAHSRRIRNVQSKVAKCARK